VSKNSLMRTASLTVSMILLMGSACSEQPERKALAVVTDIAPRVSRWHSDQVLVTARSADGLVGSKLVDAARLDCRVGEKVQATARGVSLFLDARACQR
jgi:hypothetical protein